MLRHTRVMYEEKVLRSYGFCFYTIQIDPREKLKAQNQASIGTYNVYDKTISRSVFTGHSSEHSLVYSPRFQI